MHLPDRDAGLVMFGSAMPRGLVAALCLSAAFLPPLTAVSRGADSEFSYWNGQWHIQSAYAPINDTILYFAPGKPDFQLLGLIGVLAQGKVDRHDESRTSLRGDFRTLQAAVGEELGSHGLLMMNLLPTLGLTEAVGAFHATSGGRADFGATYIGEGNRQARVDVKLVRAPGDRVLQSLAALTILASARNRGPSPIGDRETALVVRMPYDFRNDVRVTKTKHVQRCDVNELPAEELVEVRCPVLQLVPETPLAAVRLRLSVPSSTEGRTVTVEGSFETIVPGEQTIHFGTLDARTGSTSFRVKGRRATRSCRSLAGVWATTARIRGSSRAPVSGTLTLYPDGTFVEVNPQVEGSGAWRCITRNGVLSLQLGFGTPPDFGQTYPLSADRRHFEGPSGLGAYFAGDKVSDL
jgi:hypothetical protein